MRRLTIALSSGAAALALGIGTTAAMATTASTWTIKPGGNVTGTAGKTTLTDTKTHQTLSCTSSSTTAKLKSGKGQTNPLGTISAATFTNCTGPGGLMFTVKSSGFPWKLNGSSFSAGVTHGSITGVKATLSGPGCSLSVAGTSASSPGKVTGTDTNSTGILKVSGGNLHVWNVNGCFGLINSGDPSKFVGSYKISPKQTITSP
jgi:hypothetical protein